MTHNAAGDPSGSATAHSPVSTFKRPTFKFVCRICGQSTMRQQELDRHYSTFHLPCWIFCPHKGCRWRGDRKYEFMKHWNTHQYGQKPASKQYHIYNVKIILDWINGSQSGDIIPIAQNFVVDLVKERALELGKHEWLDDPWGRSGRQARRARVEPRR